tara:strand:- start:344 stop:1054 length:711 start_codon:yes stop_codon:yes gene_type:complete
VKVLVACEYSGRVRDAFIAKGHDAISCDLLPTDQPGPHYQGDVFDIIDDSFDLMICHPPCTFLTGAAEWAFDEVPMINGKPRKLKPETLVGEARREARREALQFVDALWNAPISKICLENPVGVIPKNLPNMPKPQWVQQHWFGEDASKKTGLWLKGLPPLIKSNEIPAKVYCCGDDMTGFDLCHICFGKNKSVKRWGNQTISGQNNESPGADRWKIRSTTPNGLALAMAEQWGSE